MLSIFKSDDKPQTMLDAVRQATERLAIKCYRKVAAEHGCAPTKKIQDQTIAEIYTKVTAAFEQAASQRGEDLPLNFANFIVLKFLQVYEMFGEQRFQSHLEYEVTKYISEGLRQDYKQSLQLFDPNSDDPDVARLKECQRLIREYLERNLPHNKTQTISLPYAKIADLVLRSTVAAAGTVVTCAEGATRLKLKTSTCEALLCESAAYHLKTAIANAMIARHLSGKDSYDEIESQICDAVSSILNKPGANMAQYLSLVSIENRDTARMYFLKDTSGLQISDEQIMFYAEKYNKTEVIKNIPPDQLDLIFYLIRIARLVTIGDDIDTVVMHFATQRLLDFNLELQNSICEILSQH
jgi:hypothetical protein